jgi:hypothetical protein
MVSPPRRRDLLERFWVSICPGSTSMQAAMALALSFTIYGAFTLIAALAL